MMRIPPTLSDSLCNPTSHDARSLVVVLLGDFPDLQKFKAKLSDDDFSKYPKLDLKYVVPSSHIFFACWRVCVCHNSTVSRVCLWACLSFTVRGMFIALRMIEDMDAVLSKDVPGLLAQFPSEREDQYRSLVR